MGKRKLTPFGVLVKKRLLDLEMTQVELAQAVGTSKNYLSLILYGERTGDKYLPRIIRELQKKQCTIHNS
ncbi:MAG: helix-turn-helix transcriptional regulator [Desulfitobacteriaceae bacterium]|nr:helix-turn-helix transcriptional regulator [Desulfitobacteriaceae bacterium]